MRSKAIALLGLLAFALAASASGPRFVTGPPFFTAPPGLPVGWKQTKLLYFTDPGNLSANVNHAAADALIAAAAGVWNVPVANITVAQGGQLAEHVSGTNVYLDQAGLHLPADAISANAAAVPIAVIYDTDGSVTDTLLGSGASDPSGCRQNAVTESVDAFDPAGYILHALIVVNGRCTGTANEAQLQLKYQLVRAFGRVLGLAWSQTNDNVFTGSPRPTPVQSQNWPIMHPIDILCGLYTYQCLPAPFTLRIDDLAGLVSVYPIPVGSVPGAGKQVSLTGAQGIEGEINFPTGQGMAGVNVVIRREAGTTTLPDAFYVGSGVTGAYFRQGGVSPFVARAATAAGSLGSDWTGLLGHFKVAYFPVIGTAPFENVLTSTEPVNPLYTGEHSLGPYAAASVSPSGSPVGQTTFVATALGVSTVTLTVADAPAVCGAGGDGVQASPMQAAATGWWNGLLCGYGHASYVQANVKPGRSFTLEVTALDAQGLATESKAMPLVGLYAATDPVGGAPSLGLSPSAFNGRTVGTTTLSAGTETASTIEFGIADQRGDGRPDFGYQARLFYAEDVLPARIAATGGTMTITGMGFRSGNAVSINGVNVPATSWTANTIVVAAPAMSAVHAGSGVALDVVVSDRTTGATSTIPAALTYDPSGDLPNVMRVLSAPAGTALVGDVAATPFTVQVLAADDTTPIVGEPVTFNTSLGSALFGTCGAAQCTVKTDAQGLASTNVTATAPGSITLQAVDGALHQTASWNADAQPTAMELFSVPESSVKVGTPSNSWFEVRLVGADGHTGLGGKPVVFTATKGAVTYPACSASPCTVLSDAFGVVGMPVVPTAIGPVTLLASYGDTKQTAAFTAVSNTDTMRIVAAPLDTTPGGASVFTVQLLQSDGYSADANRRVTFTASPGVTVAQCNAAVCELPTDYYGNSTGVLYPTRTGTFTAQAAYGAVVQTVTFNVTAPSRQLKLLSAPADNSPTGVSAATPFAVQLLQPDGVTPITGVMVSLAGPPGAVFLPGCFAAACEVPVDARGIASVAVTPLLPGSITMSATYAPLVTTATFKAVGTGAVMKFVAQPGSGGAPYGVVQTLTVQVTQADGVTPYSWDQVRISVLSGPFILLNTSNPALLTNTDQHGLASCQGTATGNGTVVIQATDGFVTQTITFLAGTSPDVMQILQTPSGPVTLGSGTAGKFAVRVFASDGVTPLAGKIVTFSVTNTLAVLGACSAAVCAVATDASGMASTSVTATAAGTIWLLASEANVSQTASFLAVRPPDVLQLLSVPTDGGYAGSVGAPTFVVKALLADGVSAAVGRAVVLSVTGGAATLNACGAASCSLTTDAQGLVQTMVTPLAAGTIGLLATDEGVTVAASFVVAERPDVMRILSVPQGNPGVGYAAAMPFAVQVTAADGVTPRVGKEVVFSAAGAAVRLACGAVTCTVPTGADGVASMAVTPLAVGMFTLTAIQHRLSQSASLTAVVVPDVLTVVSAPTSGGYAGDTNATPFSVRVLLGDGVTAGDQKYVTVSVTSGFASLSACGGSTCVLRADGAGVVTTFATPQAGGDVTVTATEGGVSVSATFSAKVKPDTMLLVSAPAGTLPTGVAAEALFAVKLLQGDGVTPHAGQVVTFSATSGTAAFGACGAAICTAVTGTDGVARTSVTPLVSGSITLTAAFGSLTQTVSLIGAVRPDTMRVVSSPASGGFVGVSAGLPLSVAVLQGDGVTPAVGRQVVFSVTAGNAAFGACGGTSVCSVATDALGVATTLVTPLAAGGIALQAADGAVIQAANFTAIERPDTMRIVSSPADGSYTGVVAATVFRVAVVAGDGKAPAVERSVTVSVTKGAAVLAACGGTASCTLSTDVNGMVSTAVTPRVVGMITIRAAEGDVTQSASFNAVDRPDTMHLLSSPADGSSTGVAAASPFRVALIAGDGTTAVAGRNVTVAVTNGTATLSACGGTASCTLSTDSNGMVSTAVTPGVAGMITIRAAEGDVTQSGSFNAVDRPDTMRVISSPASGGFAGAVAGVPLSVAVLQGDGVTPAVGRQVVFSVTAGSAAFGACGGAAVCSVATDALGVATTLVTPLAAGGIALQAADGAVIRAVNFTAIEPPDTMRIVSSPEDGSSTGVVATSPFRVAVVAGNGRTVGAGRNVTVAVTNGTATLSACGGTASCTLSTDSNGMVSTAVTPGVAGMITIRAAEGDVTQSGSFNAVDRPDTMRVISSPASGGFAGAVAGLPLSVAVLQGDGVTPAVGRQVVFSVTAGSAAFGACGGAAVCSVATDALGVATTLVTPLAAGGIALQAADGAVIRAVNFTAIEPPDTMRIVSSPEDGSSTGVVASSPFRVAVVAGNGTTVGAGRSVTVSVTNGAASLFACGGAASCMLSTDSNGMVSTAVTPRSAGTITIRAIVGGVMQSASFMAVDRPDTLQLVAAPSGKVFVGSTAAQAFSVRLVLGDGSPHAGASVVFSAGGAAVQLGQCGTTCAVQTDANGMASVSVTPSSAGVVTLLAAVEGLAQTASFEAVADSYALALTPPMTYVAEGAVVSIVLTASAAQNGTAAVGEPVTWTGSAGATPSQTGSATDAAGVTAVTVRLGPLASGAVAQLTACAWGQTCAVSTVAGVGPSQLEVEIASGGAQSVQGGAGLLLLVAQVTDGAGHVVAGAAVTVYQTVTALDVACPDRGRCPTAPVLASVVTATTADSQGRVSVQPLTVAGRGSQTQVVFSTGTTGFVSTLLTTAP